MEIKTLIIIFLLSLTETIHTSRIRDEFLVRNISSLVQNAVIPLQTLACGKRSRTE